MSKQTNIQNPWEGITPGNAAGGAALSSLLLLPLWGPWSSSLSASSLFAAVLFTAACLSASGGLLGLFFWLALKLCQNKKGALFLSLFILLPLLFAQYLLTQGAWIQRQWWRWPGLGLLSFLELFLLYVGSCRLAQTSHRVYLSLLFFLLALAFALLDRLFFPGLYAPFHMATQIGALLFLASSGVCLVAARRIRWLRLITPLAWLLLFPLGVWLLALPQAWSAVSRSAGVGRLFSAIVMAVGLGPKLPEAKGSMPKSMPWPENVSRPSLEQPDIVLITIDALRPDRLGAYGSQKGISPNLDALAKKSVLFTRAYSPSPTSSYSLASLFCSRYAFGKMQSDPSLWPTLAQHLAENGYRTYATYNEGIFFTDAERFSSYKDEAFGFQKNRVDYLDSYDISRGGWEELNEGPGPAFVWLHIAEPHEPYQVRPGFDRGPTPEDRYDAEVWYADKHLEQLLKPLEGRNAVIIIAADHGEAFGEHGAYYHTSDVYAEQAWIPLMIYYPGVTPRRIDAPQTLVDVGPTVLDLLGLPPLPGAQGRSVAPLFVGEPPDEAPVFSEWKNRRGVAKGRYRLLCDNMTNACELFDILDDVKETTDLSTQKPDVVRSLAGELSAFVEEQERPSDDSFTWPQPLLQLAEHDLTAAPAARPYLHHNNASIRAKAAFLLGGIGDQASREDFFSLLQDPEEEVRVEAALALANVGDARAIEMLRGLQRGQDQKRKARVIVALGALSAASAEELSEVLSCDDLELSRRALSMIVARGAPSRLVVERLLGVLSMGPLTPEVARTLAVLNVKEAVPGLIEALQKATQIPARQALVAALASMREPSALVVLSERAAFGEGGDHVAEALLAIGGNPPEDGAGGPAARVIVGPAWLCAEGCALREKEGVLRFKLPKEISERPYTLLLSASGSGSVALLAASPIGVANLPNTQKDIRIAIPNELLVPNATLTVRLRAAEGLTLYLAMLLPVPDDPSTRY